MLAGDILTYTDFLQESKEPLRIRLAMVRRFKEVGNISLVAKEFQTTRKTVGKWITHFSGAISSLHNLSKAPKAPNRQIALNTERVLIEFKKEHSSLRYDY